MPLVPEMTPEQVAIIELLDRLRAVEAELSTRRADVLRLSAQVERLEARLAQERMVQLYPAWPYPVTVSGSSRPRLADRDPLPRFLRPYPWSGAE